MSRVSATALVVLFAIIPLYGTFGALDPDRPPIPPLVPQAVTVAIALVALAAMLAVVPAARRAARRDTLTIALFAPSIAIGLAGLVGFDPPTGLGLALLAAGFAAAGLAVARGAGPALVRRCVRALLWSALVGSLIPLAMLVAHRPAALYAYNNGRAVGTFLNPNELAAFALATLGVAAPLAAASRGRDRLATACAVVLLITLFATFSRWGVFAAVCGVVVYALAARARVLLVGAVAVAVAGIALNQVAGALHHNPRDTEARVVAWQAGLTTFERFPLTGVGPFAYGRTYDAFRPPDGPGPKTPVAFDPHSLPIAYAAHSGLAALASFAVLITILVRGALRSARGAAPRSRAVAIGLAAGLVALLVDGAINTISLVIPLLIQVGPLALAVVRTDALD